MMNYVAKSLSRPVQRRMMSTGSADVSHTVAKLRAESTFKNNWLQDPSTYPLLVSLGCAAALCSGVGFSCLAFNPDVRIASAKKNSPVRNW